MKSLLPENLLRRVYVTVAVLAFLPPAVIVLGEVMAKVLGPVLLLLVPTIVVIRLWRIAFGRRS